MKLLNDAEERWPDGLKRNVPKTPKFHLRLKIPKEGNPSHPVVSSVNSHATNISMYGDCHPHSIVKEVPSYVKDTRFSKKVRESKRYLKRVF